MNRTDALDMAKDSKMKLKKMNFKAELGQTISPMQSQFNMMVLNATIWIDRYASFHDGEQEPEQENEAIKEPLSDPGLSYRRNYLSSMAERLVKFGSKADKPEEMHSLIKALDYLHEAKSYLEYMG